MNVKKIFERISNIEIPEIEKKLIEDNFTFCKYRKNNILISDHQDCDKIFFIIKGAVRIFYFNQFKTEVTRTFIFENEFCTNLVSFSGKAINNENIECLEDTLAFYITRDKFYEMLQKSQLLTKLYSKILEHFIHKNLIHFQFMNTLNDRQRIEKFLKDSQEINRRVKDKIIATYLGISPQFYSRTKSEIFKKT